MRDLINIVDDHDILWHGTSEPAKTIKKHGLLTNAHGHIFLTDNPQLALEYAESDQDRTGYDTITLVSVKVKSLDQSLLIGDIHHTGISGWRESLKETDQCIYQDNIPPNQLAAVEKY